MRRKVVIVSWPERRWSDDRRGKGYHRVLLSKRLEWVF